MLQEGKSQNVSGMQNDCNLMFAKVALNWSHSQEQHAYLVWGWGTSYIYQVKLLVDITNQGCPSLVLGALKIDLVITCAFKIPFPTILWTLAFTMKPSFSLFENENNVETWD